MFSRLKKKDVSEKIVSETAVVMCFVHAVLLSAPGSLCRIMNQHSKYDHGQSCVAKAV